MSEWHTYMRGEPPMRFMAISDNKGEEVLSTDQKPWKRYTLLQVVDRTEVDAIREALLAAYADIDRDLAEQKTLDVARAAARDITFAARHIQEQQETIDDLRRQLSETRRELRMAVAGW